MILQRKIDRAFKKLHEQSDRPESKLYANPETRKEEDAPELEKGDVPAMIIAAFLTFLPAAILVLGGIALLGYFFLFH